MGQYNKAIITAAGESLISRTVAGELKLNITKAKISDYKYPDGTDYKALTDMDGVKQILDYPETKVLDNNMIQTRVLFSNEEIQDAYYIQNIGLYAKDGEGEILFCIVTAKTPDEMPKYHGVASTSYIYNIQNVVQDAAEVNIEVVPSGTATIQDVMERVDASGGDISETVIETMESIDTKYPVPSAGESTKVFMGKIKKYIEDTRPIDKNIGVKVSPAGEDIPGGFAGGKLYKTIQYAVNTLPKNLNGKTAVVVIDAGTYDEDVVINGFSNGKLSIQYSAGQTTLTTECNVKSITVSYCDSVFINGFNLTGTGMGIVSERCNYVDITYCQQNTAYTGYNTPSFKFTGISYGRIYGCQSTNHDICMMVYSSIILSEKWTTDSKAISGILLGSGAQVVYGYGSQPKGIAPPSDVMKIDKGMITVNQYGADIGSLPYDVDIYVSNSGNDNNAGTSSKPYKTISYALSTIPKDLGGHIATINIADGIYDEAVIISGYKGGYLVIKRKGMQELNTLCNIKSIRVEFCGNVSMSGLNFTNTNGTSVYANVCEFVDIEYCQSVIATVADETSFYFGCVSVGRIGDCRSLNHDICLQSYLSNVASYNWAGDSLGKSYGIVSEGGRVTNANTFQPKGLIARATNRIGGITVSNFGARIGTLPYDLTLYVATTGSDTTGDGTSAKPYKTIQCAINTLPKDLGGRKATVNIADGTYSERIVINGFYNGWVKLTGSKPDEVSSVCNIADVSIIDNPSSVDIRGINFTTTTANGVYAVVSGFVIVAYCRCALSTTWSGFSFDQTRFEIFGCLIANKGIALMSHGADGNSRYCNALSINNTVGLHAEFGAIIKKDGPQPQATIPERCHSAGSITNENGTQISDIISSGVSCTWGLVRRGGYVRIGKLTGAAMITVDLNIQITTALTAGQLYYITGLPRPVQNAGVAGYCHANHFYRIEISSDGTIILQTINNMAVGGTFTIGATYLTNS